MARNMSRRVRALTVKKVGALVAREPPATVLVVFASLFSL
jgi:hypothetical protein